MHKVGSEAAIVPPRTLLLLPSRTVTSTQRGTMVRVPSVEINRDTYEFMPLLAHPLARFRLQTVFDMQELVVKVLDG